MAKTKKPANLGRYSLAMRIMHWVLAALIISLLIVGILMTEYMDAPGKFEYYKLHKAFGIMALFLIIIRIAIRFKTSSPKIKMYFQENLTLGDDVYWHTFDVFKDGVFQFSTNDLCFPYIELGFVSSISAGRSVFPSKTLSVEKKNGYMS